MAENYLPGFSYADFAPMLKGELFDSDPDSWAKLILNRVSQFYVVIHARTI